MNMPNLEEVDASKTSIEELPLSVAAENSNLKSFKIPTTCMKIDDSAFCDCCKLSSIECSGGINSGLNFIGTSAFANTDLSDFERFNDSDPNHTFNKVGNYAFANTKLSSVNLSLKSSTIDNFWGSYCF